MSQPNEVPITLGSPQYSELVRRMQAWVDASHSDSPQFLIQGPLLKPTEKEKTYQHNRKEPLQENESFVWYKSYFGPPADLAKDVADFGLRYPDVWYAMMYPHVVITPALFDWFAQLYYGEEIPDWRDAGKESLSNALSWALGFHWEDKLRVIAIDVERRKIVLHLPKMATLGESDDGTDFCIINTRRIFKTLKYTVAFIAAK